MSQPDVATIYKKFALIALNTLVFLVVANLALFGVFWAKDNIFNPNKLNPVATKYGESAWPDVYPVMTSDAIHRLLDETWSRPQAYAPFSQVREAPFRGEFINVAEAGFRVGKDQGPWPPARGQYTVFMFGGSTLFGYSVPDDQTIASYLQESLAGGLEVAVRVYNFGTGYHQSTQERALFEQLMLAGYVPQLAIFVDGLNEFAFHYGLAHTDRLTEVCNTRRKSGVAQFIDELPISRLATWIRRRVAPPPPPAPAVKPERTTTEGGDDGIAARVVQRYLDNRRLIEASAGAYGVKTVFAWQPIPTYKYDLSHHHFAEGGFNINRHAAGGYAHFAGLLKKRPLGKNFLWCADMQENLSEPLYVDRVHYSAWMNRLIAHRIAELMIERRLLR